MTLADPEEKKRFLRLLEEDVPELIICQTCNTFYRWSKPWHYQCPHHFTKTEHMESLVRYCPKHGPYNMNRQVVHAYLRGHEKGRAYGPQLSELVHECNESIYLDREKSISRAAEARVVGGKFILHFDYQLSIPLAPLKSMMPGLARFRDFDLPPWQRPPPLADRDAVLPGIDKFCDAGCHHSFYTLPAVIMDAIEHFQYNSEEKKRCHGLLNCGRCATDLLVGIVAEEEGCVRIRVDTWHCFGGRNSDQNDVMETTMFDWSVDQPFEPATISRRNLQRLFNGEAGEDDYSLVEVVREGRQSWLQLWEWLYFKDSRMLTRYRVPSDEDRTKT